MFDAITFWLDWFGVAVFATTGALVASRKQMDLIGFVVLATVTGIGGGSIRDVMLGSFPFFWLCALIYLLTWAAVAVVTILSAFTPQSLYALLLRFDAIGSGSFAVVGSATALAMSAYPSVAVAMGVITATFGG